MATDTQASIRALHQPGQAMRAAIAVCALLASAVGALAADVDWKLFGWAEDKQYCFYDAEGVSFQSVGRPRVWTKCFNEDEMEAAAAADPENIINRAADKVVKGYLPPITPYAALSSDQIISTIQYEQTADLNTVQPTATIYYDLDCRAKMIRHLQVWTRKVSGQGSQKWNYVAPQTNGDRLLKMVCQ